MFYCNVAVYQFCTIFTKLLYLFRVGSNELIGCAAIGYNILGIGHEHWFEMIENPRKPVAQWYPLQEKVPELPGGYTPNGKSKGCL